MGYFTIGHFHIATAVSVYIDIDGTSHTDGIRNLNQHFIGYAGCHHILGNMTGSVCSTTVYLAGVFTGESTTTVSTFSTVSINDNLTSCQTGIPVRTADNEFTGRIHMINYPVIEQSQNVFIMNLCNDTGHQDFNYIFANLRQHLFISFQLSFFRGISRGHELIVLGRNHNGIDTDRLSVIIIFDSHLTLCIGTEVSHYLSFTTNFSQDHQQFMRQVE